MKLCRPHGALLAMAAALPACSLDSGGMGDASADPACPAPCASASSASSSASSASSASQGGAGAGGGGSEGGAGATGGASVPDDWYDPAWRRRRPIVVDHDDVEASLDDFPLLVVVDDPTVISLLAPDAADLLVTAADGKTKRSHEVELLDGELVVWIGVPTLSADDDTTLFIYYDDPGASNQQDAGGVWDAHAMGVWHFGEDVADESSGAQHADSTQNQRHGTQSGNGAVPGRIGRAQEFDGGGDHVQVSQPEEFVLGNADCTVSAWIRTDSSAEMGILLKSDGVVHEPGDKLFGVNHTPSALGIDHGWVTYLGGTSDVIDGDWHHVVWTQEKDASGSDEEWTLYVDGESQGAKSAATTADVPGHTLRIGWHADSSYFSQPFEGAIDEVVVSSTTRSSAWVRASFENQRSPSSFAVVGPEQALP